jgi:PKD repeat protein
MVRYMRAKTGIFFFIVVSFIFCAASVSSAYASCGDTIPYDGNSGTLPNGYYPPSADFSGQPVQGNAPLAVSFSDKSTNAPLNWAWNFGDGQSSNEKNPVHTYQNSGTYSITLTAGNGYGGNSVIKADYIVVNSLSSTPVIDFTANVTSGKAPLQVEFTDLSSGGTIISRAWTFSRDGIPGKEAISSQKIVHNFSEAGQYNVTLTVTASNNQSASLEKAYYISAFQSVPEQGTITLHPGWNVISPPLPLKDQFRNASQVFAGINTDYHSIYSYDAGSKQFIPLNSQSEILPLEGIWVYSKKETPLTFNYQVNRSVMVSMHMLPGWNLIGYPSVEQGSARAGYGSINAIWSTILCFDPVTQQYSSTIFNEGAEGLSDQYMMQPMNGYWLFMPKQGDLVISFN